MLVVVVNCGSYISDTNIFQNLFAKLVSCDFGRAIFRKTKIIS